MTIPTPSKRKTSAWRNLAIAAAVALAIPVALHWDAVVDTLAEATGARNPEKSAVYYLPSQLDKRPYLLTRVDPVYPRVAPASGGQVVLRLLISEEGRVERMVVEKSNPPKKFDEAAMAAFRDAHYSSGILAGKKVKSQIMVEVTFNPILPPRGK